MSKTYLEIGAGTTGNGRAFGYNPSAFKSGDRLVLADLRVRFGCEDSLEDASGYPSVIFPSSKAAESLLGDDNCDGQGCRLCQLANIQLLQNTEFEEHCTENGIELAHIYTDGRSIGSSDNVYDEVLFRNVFSDPRLSKDDAKAMLAEAARVSLGGVMTLIETYTPGWGLQNVKEAASDVGLRCEMYSTDNEGLISFELDHRLALSALKRYNTSGLEIPNAHVYFLRFNNS